MSKIEEYFENLVKNRIISQVPANYDAGTMEIYIDHLEAENAALRERLERSVDRLKARERSVCFGREWEAVVTDEDIDEVFGIAEAHIADLKGEKK